jgi:hypothetical protein
VDLLGSRRNEGKMSTQEYVAVLLTSRILMHYATQGCHYLYQFGKSPVLNNLNKLIYRPNVVYQSCFHRRRHPKRELY